MAEDWQRTGRGEAEEWHRGVAQRWQRPGRSLSAFKRVMSLILVMKNTNFLFPLPMSLLRPLATLALGFKFQLGSGRC